MFIAPALYPPGVLFRGNSSAGVLVNKSERIEMLIIKMYTNLSPRRYNTCAGDAVVQPRFDRPDFISFYALARAVVVGIVTRSARYIYSPSAVWRRRFMGGKCGRIVFACVSRICDL